MWKVECRMRNAKCRLQSAGGSPQIAMIDRVRTICALALVFASARAPASAQAPADAGAAHVVRFATVNGLRLHYLDRGAATKPALILLHGIARHAHTFDHIAGGLARDYHVIALDMRGHGDSAWSPEGAYLVEDYVKDLEGLVGQLGIRRLTLLGNSTGGRVVQVFAGLHPGLVEWLIVEDVGPERAQDIASGFARRGQQGASGWGSEAARVLQLVMQTPRTPEPLLRTYASFGTRRQADGRLVWKRVPNLVKGFISTDLWEQVSKITSPALYVVG